MGIFFIAFGALLIVIGSLMVAMPERSAKANSALTNKWMRDHAPPFWQGREALKARAAGVAFVLFGLVFLGNGIAWPTHRG